MKLSPEQFALAYDGIVSSPRGFAGGERRVIGKVLDKLEAVATATEIRGLRNSAITYRVTQEVEVLLDEPELKLAIQAIDAVEWMARASREADALIAYLQAQTNGKAA